MVLPMLNDATINLPVKSMMKPKQRSWLVLLILLTLVFPSNILASQIQKLPQATGIWHKANDTEDKTFQWKSNWIWHQSLEQADRVLFRKKVNFSSLPEEAILRITASSLYQLYINGQYVLRGPARSAPHHQSYDILDISSLLQIGENVIAVQVHHQANKKSYHHKARAGLLAQIDYTDKTGPAAVYSNSSWRALVDPSWDNNAPRINRFQRAVTDRVDLQKSIRQWQAVNFDDSQWTEAKSLLRNSGWPGSQKNAKARALTPPWTALLPRKLPYLVETNIKATTLISATEIDDFFQPRKNKRSKKVQLKQFIDPVINRGLEAYQKYGKPIHIPASKDHNKHKTWLLVFDMGKIHNGMPSLDIEGIKGTEVEIISIPFMVDNQFTDRMVDSDLLDKVTLSGARDRWQAQYFKPGRYLGLVLQSGAVPVKIHAVGVHQIEYPFNPIGSITSKSAPWINQYMQASALTIRATTTDAYTDNYRERRQYAQTGYYAALGNYYLFGDNVLQARYLQQVAEEQQANGLMPAYGPLLTDDYMVILDSNCLWIRSLRNYLLYSGDEKTVRDLLPVAFKLMALLDTYTNSSGLLDNPPYAYWLDHARNDRRGANLTLNGHYLGAVEDFAELLNWLKVPGTEALENQAKTMREAMSQQFWDNKKGLFVDAVIDGKKSSQYSEHGNAMALAMQIATKSQAKGVAEQLLIDDNNNDIKRRSGMTMVTPAMSYFLHKGLADYGYIDESLQLFQRRFARMLQADTNSTLWEEWWLDATGRSGKLLRNGRTRSDAQTESVFPPALFAEFLLGLKPLQPGMKLLSLKRTNSAIKDISALVPTPQGNLKIEWKFNVDDTGELSLKIPENITIELDGLSLCRKKSCLITINGEQQIFAQGADNPLMINEGSHLIAF